MVKSTGASESAREWSKEVKASALWEQWETLEPEVQFEVLSYTYEQNAELVRLSTTRNKEKKQPMIHLYVGSFSFSFRRSIIASPLFRISYSQLSLNMARSPAYTSFNQFLEPTYIICSQSFDKY